MKTLSPDTLWQLPRVGGPAPAGRGQVIVPVTTFDVDENKGLTRLWMVDHDGKTRPLTAASTDSRKPVVCPRGERVSFVRKVDGRDQIHLMSIGGGEAEVLTHLPLGVLGAKWLPSGNALIVLAYLLKGHLTPEGTAAELERRKTAKFTVHTTEQATYRYWDTWLTSGEVPHLFLVEAPGGEARDLTPDSERWWRWPSTDDPIASFDVSPDGSEIAYAADGSEPPHRLLRFGIFSLDVETRRSELLTKEEGQYDRPRYSPDGDTLIYGMQRIPDFYGDRVRLVAYDRGLARHRVLTEDWDRSAHAWEFDGEGKLALVAEDRGRRHLFRLGPDDPVPVVVAAGGTLSDPAVAEDGTVYLLSESISQPPEVVRLGAGGELHRVTRFTEAGLSGIELGKVDDLSFSGADGDPVQMFLVYPPLFDAAGRWPLVQLIHGGPHGIFGDAWHWRWNVHCFAAPGQIVALVNFHGSSSFGQAFTASIEGTWGDQPYRDIEAATDHLIGLGFIDEAHMAVAGGSYGGYLAAYITAQTDRYACAVAHAAVTNLAGMYASDLTEGRRRAFGAEIWEDRAKVERFSPSTHAAGYGTPTLIIHGERDYRVPLTQGLELYGVLTAKGISARLVYYPEENHWILSPQSSLHWYGEVLGWLNLYLR